MGIVLSILKIVGMILVILGIVIACVLLIPLQYEGSGDIDKNVYGFRLSWLFRIIQFRFQGEGDISVYDIYLFGIRTGILDPKHVERRKKSKAKRKRKKYLKARKRYLKEKEKRQAQISLDPDEKKLSDPENRERVSTHKTVEQKEAGISGSETQKAGSGKFSDLVQKVKKVCGVIKSARQAELLHLLLPLKTLAYHMRPRKIKGDIRFGFVDPSLTGKTVGAISCVFVLYQYEELHITPDFETEENFFSGSVWGKGHICMIHVLLCGIRIFKQKEFRRFLKSLKQN